MKAEKIYTQHKENEEWMNNATFYRDEIKILEGRLSEVASKNTSKEVLKQVEHFQNQFTIQKDRLDELKHEINLSNDKLKKEINKNPTAVEHRSVEDHLVARQNMNSYEKIFSTFKIELNTFLSKWM